MDDQARQTAALDRDRIGVMAVCVRNIQADFSRRQPGPEGAVDGAEPFRRRRRGDAGHQQGAGGGSQRLLSVR